MTATCVAGSKLTSGGGVSLAQQVTEARVALEAVEHDDLVVRDAGGRCGGAGDRQQRAHGEEHLRAGVLQLTRHLLGGVERVDRRRGRARAQDAVEHRRERRHVRRVQGDDVADPEPAGGERAGEQVDLRLERAVGGLGPARAVDQRDASRILGVQVLEQEVVDAELRDDLVGIRAREHAISFDRPGR